MMIYEYNDVVAFWGFHFKRRSAPSIPTQEIDHLLIVEHSLVAATLLFDGDVVLASVI